MNASGGVRARYRRDDKLPLVVAILLAAGPVANMVLNGPHSAGEIVGLLGMLPLAVCLGYLAGPAAAVGVTPERVIVDNPFFRYSVPRHLVADIGVLENIAVDLVAKDGTEIPVHAVLPAIGSPGGGPGRRRLLGKVRTLLQMIDDVPVAQTTGAVDRTLRLGSVLLVVGSGASFGLSVLLLTG